MFNLSWIAFPCYIISKRILLSIYYKIPTTDFRFFSQRFIFVTNINQIFLVHEMYVCFFNVLNLHTWKTTYVHVFFPAENIFLVYFCKSIHIIILVIIPFTLFNLHLITKFSVMVLVNYKKNLFYKIFRGRFFLRNCL